MEHNGHDDSEQEEELRRMIRRRYWQAYKRYLMSVVRGDPQPISYQILVYNTPEHIQPYLRA